MILPLLRLLSLLSARKTYVCFYERFYDEDLCYSRHRCRVYEQAYASYIRQARVYTGEVQ